MINQENAEGSSGLGNLPGPATNPSLLRICALLPEEETAASTLQCAVAAGKGRVAEIAAVHVGFNPRGAFVDAEERDIQGLRDLYEGAPAVRTAHIVSAVDAFMKANPQAPRIVWRDDIGDIDANIVDEARAASLFVIGRPAHLDASDALHSVLFDTHRLLLIAPQSAATGERMIGRHIAIGWKPGPAVQQTAVAALPWIRTAAKVSVIWVPKAGCEPYDVSAQTFFRTLGVQGEILRIERDRHSVGVQLLSEAMRLGADCLLIGAFRHSALWQSVLGGVTRDVLAHAEIPVFMMRAQSESSSKRTR